MLLQEQQRDRRGASPPPPHPREQPLLPPHGDGGRTGTRRRGITSPLHPGAASTPRGTVSHPCAPKPCPHRAGPASLHWGQDRGHMWLCILDLGDTSDIGVRGHRSSVDTGTSRTGYRADTGTQEDGEHRTRGIQGIWEHGGHRGHGIEGILEHEEHGGHKRTQLIWDYRGTLGTQLIWEHRWETEGHEHRQRGNTRDMKDTADTAPQADGEHGHMGTTVPRGQGGQSC